MPTPVENTAPASQSPIKIKLQAYTGLRVVEGQEVEGVRWSEPGSDELKYEVEVNGTLYTAKKLKDSELFELL